jgi:hypothetical protein
LKGNLSLVGSIPSLSATFSYKKRSYFRRRSLSTLNETGASLRHRGCF